MSEQDFFHGKYTLGESRTAYCTACDKETSQVIAPYDPDDPDGFIIWECAECGEEVEFL